MSLRSSRKAGRALPGLCTTLETGSHEPLHKHRSVGYNPCIRSASWRWSTRAETPETPETRPHLVPKKGFESLAKTIYVGNLPWSATEDDLNQLVSQHATVLSARVATDRETGRSRGFGFVEVEDDQLQDALDALQNVEMGGRLLTINEARPREPRGPRR